MSQIIYTPGKLVLAKDYTEGDRYFSNVSLLLHGNGTNGSTAIVDSSPTPKTVTAVGNAQISTAQSKFGGASIAFDGNGDQLTILDVNANNSNLTVECWLRLNAYPSSFALIATTYAGTVGANQLNTWIFGVNSTGTIYAGGALGGASTTGTAPIGQWVHVAFVYTHTNQSRVAYLNGVAGAVYSSEAITNTSETRVLIGGSSGASNIGTFWLDGYIDDLRITKGIARYTANFTPPTAAFADAQY